MKKKHLDFNKFLTNSLKDQKIRDEYIRLQPEFMLIDALIRVRNKRGLTQKELAKRIGTKQSVISRLESGRANPSISFLKKLAGALDSQLQIKFVQR
jgi:ribosome-binding protein aMBF1 (putative translation factor)